MKNNLLLVFLALCITLPSTQVEARKGLGSLFKLGRGAKAINGAKHYNSGTLTVAQLKACLMLEQKIESSEIDLSSKQSPVVRQEQKIEKIEREISTLKRYLDLNQKTTFYTQQQVDDFNRKVERYNEFLPAYNRELEAYKNLETIYNGAVGRHNKMVNEFQVSCAGKRYYEDDLLSAKSALTN